MNRDAFALMAREEQDHWWFRGRRDFIARAIRTLALPTNASLLDAGCGSGGTMALLRQFGTVAGFEYDAEAREQARAPAASGGWKRARCPDRSPSRESGSM